MMVKQTMSRLLLYVLIATVVSACSSVKQVPYFQDLREGDGSTQVIDPTVVRIQPQDKIYVMVSGKDSRLTAPYNIQTTNTSTGAQRNIGYTVDNEGNIDFPGLGTIHVGGLTRKEVADKIKNILIERQLVKEPVVFVEFMNLSFTILGDVSGPGRYNIEKDQITLLDAIGMAGDLTISAKRKNVMVLREKDGVQQSYTVDLTSAEQLMNSPVYYLQQDDIIYVEPNRTKAGQASPDGNMFRSFSSWVAVISFIASMAAIIAK